MIVLSKPYIWFSSKNIFVFALFIILFIVNGCQTKSSIQKNTQCELLDHIESLMLEYPEQVDSLISRIDTLKMTQSDRARYFLIRGFYDSWNGRHTQSIHEISIAETIFSDLGDEYHQNLNNLMKAFSFEYLNLDNNAASLYLSCNEYFKKEKLEKLKFYSTLGLIRLSNVINSDKATLIDEAKANITKLNSPIFDGLFYSALGNIEKNDTLRINQYELAKKDFILAKSWHRAYTMEINLLFPKIRLDHSDRMEQYYWQLSKRYQFYEPIDYLKMRYKYAQGYLYSKQGKSKDAILIVEKILKELNSKNIPEIELDCVKFLAVLNIRIGNYKQACTYQYRQSELEVEKKEALKQNQILALSSHYRFTELEQEKLGLKLKYKNTFFLLCIITLTFTFILCVTWFILKQSRLKQEILRNKNMKVEDQLNNLINSLEKEKDKNLHLITQLEAMKIQYHEQYVSEFIEVIDKRQVASWIDFEAWFLKSKSGWIENIKKATPDLTPVDIKYCMCLYFNLNNQKIADLCCVSNETVKSAKKRLRDKFSLEDATEIYVYLKKFD